MIQQSKCLCVPRYSVRSYFRSSFWSMSRNYLSLPVPSPSAHLLLDPCILSWFQIHAQTQRRIFRHLIYVFRHLTRRQLRSYDDRPFHFDCVGGRIAPRSRILSLTLFWQSIYGITCLQVYMFFVEYSSKDPLLLKIFVSDPRNWDS